MKNKTFNIDDKVWAAQDDTRFDIKFYHGDIVNIEKMEDDIIYYRIKTNVIGKYLYRSHDSVFKSKKQLILHLKKEEKLRHKKMMEILKNA